MFTATGILKSLIAVLLIANLAFAGYNASLMIGRFSYEDEIEEGRTDVGRTKRLIYDYEADITRIQDEKLTVGDRPAVYFADRAREAGLDPDTDLKKIPNVAEKGSRIGAFQEEIWKIQFAKAKVVTLRQIAQFCEAIETQSPGFLIKEIDLGRRSDVWGKDEWHPRSITVRRLIRRTDQKKNR